MLPQEVSFHQEKGFCFAAVALMMATNRLKANQNRQIVVVSLEAEAFPWGSEDRDAPAFVLL